MNHYSPASEAVDNHLSDAIKDLKGSTVRGLDRVERRMDDLASKDAVEAQIARLDTRVDHAEKIFESGLKSVQLKMEEGFSAIEVRDKARDDVAEKRDLARDHKFARRMGWTLTGVGLAFAAFQLAINVLTG